MVDITKLLKDKIKLGVIDAITPMEGPGPIYGKAVEGFNTIIASKDHIAADTVACGVMHYDPWDHDMIRLADFQGLGVGKLDQIIIKGTPLSDFTYKFENFYPHVKGVFKNIDVIEGGVCRSCRAWIWFALKALEGAYDDFSQVIADSVGTLTILTGIEPPLPEKVTDLKGKVIVFGDCAIHTTGAVRRELRTNAAYVLGCPPFDIGPVVRQIKRAMSLEVSGTEAYEGYKIAGGRTGAKAHEEEIYEDAGGYGDDVLPLT